MIVGKGSDSRYEKYCKKLATDDARIIFWGEEPDILKIYALSDYVVRGEIAFRIGRTIFEALYSDCDVIVPGEMNAIAKIEAARSYAQKIHAYKPRDTESLRTTLESVALNKIKKKSFHSNVPLYANNFSTYMREIFITQHQNCEP